MDYVAVLALPAEQKTWRAGDVPALTAACLYPLPMGPDPVVTVLLRIDKVRGKDVQKPLSSADRVELQACWRKCGLAPPSEPMSSDQWVPYLEAFNLNQDGGAKRKRWVFAVQPPDGPQRVVGIAQAISETNHTKRLKQAIESREVTVRLPDMTEAPEGLNLNRVYLTWSEVVKFGALLCIQVIDVAVQKDAYTVGWYDETMEASHWFSIRDLDPLRAAMLLSTVQPVKRRAIQTGQPVFVDCVEARQPAL